MRRFPQEVSIGEDERHKGKRQCIASIMGGSPRVSNSSKSTVKMESVELMAVSKKQRITFTKSPKRPILEFQDNEKVGGIPNEIFPLVITVAIPNLDTSKILI